MDRKIRCAIPDFPPPVTDAIHECLTVSFPNPNTMAHVNNDLAASCLGIHSTLYEKEESATGSYPLPR